MESKVRKYVRSSWEKALTELKTERFSLPYPFVPPCVNGDFRVLYYWDTYFTNVGLIADGRTELAKNNVNDLLYALECFGCVPNCAKEDGAAYASQPPLLGLMIRDIYRATQDDEWLKAAIKGLEKEYAFWMRERMTSIGLNQYKGNTEDTAMLVEYYDYICTRLPIPKEIPQEEKKQAATHFLAEGESGEDFTPRYLRHNALDYVQIDLNAHLYGVEDFLSRYFADKDKAKSERYQAAKTRRKSLLDRYCYNEKQGIYFDYDFVAKKQSSIVCAASFLPWFYGFGRGTAGLEKVYETLKSGGGIYACQDVGDASYQWGYPNIWAPHQYFAYVALKESGLVAQAKTLAESYVKLLFEAFEKTGCLWERYDENGVAPSLEYTTQEMLGWTAGVYNYFEDELTQGERK